MELFTYLDLLPIWALFLTTVAFVIVAIEFGQWLARYQQKRGLEINSASVGPMVGAILGLLAFMLAFTFGFAASRFEERKQIVLNEVNVIGTLYLRAELMPESIKSETRRLLREYVAVRLEGTSKDSLTHALERSKQIHQALWAQAVAAGNEAKPPINSLFIASVNELIDTHSKRVNAGLRNRLPGTIWIALYSLMFLAMTAVGYQAGLSSAKRTLAGIIIVLAFSAVISVIADLDRPGAGLIRVSQAGMTELKEELSQAPAN
ncbi:MAG TPA: hypothetical protein VJV05_08990 [Pyrinomonadaceae bacterium]|nr:hypothetical protein [Pyrinomonadaceae bacterium]